MLRSKGVEAKRLAISIYKLGFEVTREKKSVDFYFIMVPLRDRYSRTQARGSGELQDPERLRNSKAPE